MHAQPQPHRGPRRYRLQHPQLLTGLVPTQTRSGPDPEHPAPSSSQDRRTDRAVCMLTGKPLSPGASHRLLPFLRRLLLLPELLPPCLELFI